MPGSQVGQEINRGTTISGLIRLLRPRQWVKNVFVLPPLVFTESFLDINAISSVLLAMLFFCVASSATYIVNDIRDIEHDRKHPIKSKTRPLVSGDVQIQHAIILLILLYGVLAWGFFLQPSVMLVIAGYLVLNIAYTFFLKHQPLFDIFTIAIGFVLRVYAGAVALSVPVSSWMFVTTLCLALYLAAVKRKQELALQGDSSRKVLEKYTVSLVERYAEMSATGTLIFYSLFVVSVRPEMVITIPFVIFGLFRYWYVVELYNEGESPTDVLLKDWQLLVTVALWSAVTVWAIWPTEG